MKFGDLLVSGADLGIGPGVGKKMSWLGIKLVGKKMNLVQG